MLDLHFKIWKVIVESQLIGREMIISDFQKNNSRFLTHKITTGVYSIEDLSETFHPLGDLESSLKIKYDTVSKKTKPNLKPFARTFGTLRFLERSFFNTSLGFTPFWDYKPTITFHADS